MAGGRERGRKAEGEAERLREEDGERELRETS